MVVNPAFWRNKRVLITGHTGFKGAWLALWLQQMQAEVYGLALAPATNPNLFDLAGIGDEMQSFIGDIADPPAVQACFRQARPDIVFHMAAQALVRYGYQHPLETYRTNVIGSLNVLEAIRETGGVKAAIMVTSDKCYENQEWLWPYRENDVLGGYDPYSSSKACMELLVASYRRSFFAAEDTAAIATVRAGNVIGGGDWAEERLLPDLIRAVSGQQPIIIRNPRSIRPWQHVLEPLSGYLRLAEHLYCTGKAFAEAWNFGPNGDSAKDVQWIVERAAQFWPELSWRLALEPDMHEAATLKLDSGKAIKNLAWQGLWPLPEALNKTLEWYQQQMSGANMRLYSLRQIAEYTQGACQ